MASQTEASPETQQQNFEQAVALSMHLWPALTLAVQNNWSDNDAEDVRDWFAGVVVELFPSFVDLAKFQAQQSNNTNKAAKKSDNLEEPEVIDVEERLMQVMADEYKVAVDDDSCYELAQQIVRLRGLCAKSQFDEVKHLETRWLSRKGQKVVMKQAPEANQDTDWEDTDDDEDDEGDVDMDEAPPLVQIPKEKPPPEVDEDGFTKVTRKKK